MARPTLSLRAAIGPGTPDENVFIIGESLIGGTDVIAGREIIGQGTWEELSDRCYHLSTRRGRRRALDAMAAGTMTAELDNADGALDPTYTAGPYTDSGESRVRAMAAIEVTATYLGVTYDVCMGYADNWKPILNYPQGGRTVLAATDAFKIFARLNPAEQTAIGAGDTTDQRINRILDTANWSTSLRDVASGDYTHQDTTLAQPILTQMRLAADSEDGYLYMSADGKVTFRGYLSRYLDGVSLTPQWTFGDATSGEEYVAVFDAANNDDMLRNDIRVARVGGSQIIRQTDTVAAAPYLASTYTRTDLTVETDEQVTDFADRKLRLFGETNPQITSITLEPDGYDNLWPIVLGAQIGFRITVNVRHPSTGNLWASDYFIEGIDHDIPVLESGGRWRTVLHLADASRFPTNPFIIGTSLIGGTDVLV